MKKMFYLITIIVIILLTSGCGNDLKVTVYNATGLVQFQQQYIALNAHTEHHDQWFDAETTAGSADDLDSTNSFSFTAKENDTLTVGANGQKYPDTSGNTAEAVVAFQIPVSTQVLYGGFLDNPNWYAAVNLQSVIIYRK
jgi:uncharacterized protein YxeA